MHIHVTAPLLPLAVLSHPVPLSGPQGIQTRGPSFLSKKPLAEAWADAAVLADQATSGLWSILDTLSATVPDTSSRHRLWVGVVPLEAPRRSRPPMAIASFSSIYVPMLCLGP